MEIGWITESKNLLKVLSLKKSIATFIPSEDHKDNEQLVLSQKQQKSWKYLLSGE